MYEDVQQQLIEQSTNLQKDVRSAEANLAILKESYLKVQGALELLSHLKTLEEEKTTTSEDEKKNVSRNESESV